MTKRQVIILSFCAALPALGALAAAVSSALSHGPNYSLVAWILTGSTGLLGLLIGISPFLMMQWYPAEGFKSDAPPPVQPAEPGDGAVDDFEEDSFADDGGFSDEEFAEDEDFDDEYEDFDDDDDDDEWK